MEAVGTFDFKGSEVDELSFKQGTLMLITDTNYDENWYGAEIGNRVGVVPSNYIEVSEQTWFNGTITRADSDKLLIRKPVGCFVIRTSESSPGDFSLSVRCYESVQHFKILRDAQKKFYVWAIKFYSLNRLVRYHREYSISRTHDIKLRNMPISTRAGLNPKPIHVIAMYNFVPQEEGELAFKKGQIITVTNHSDLHWWEGKTATAEGLFPAAYVTICRTRQ